MLLALFWDYVSVALMQLALVLASGVFKVWTERQQRLELRAMATINELVWSRRAEGWVRLPCAELCVGDAVCLVNGDGGDGAADDDSAGGGGVLVAADCMLAAGACVVDESMLTGETMPIQKFPAEDDARPRDPDASGGKKVYLFSGTHLLHATGAPQEALPPGVSEGALAVVSHVGARSTRGALFRTLLFGAPLQLQMAAEARFVIVLLAGIGLLDFLAVSATCDPRERDETCPISTGGGTRRVQLVREGGGGGGV